MAVIQPTINQQNAEIAKNRAIAKALRESERYDLPPDASVQVGPYRHAVKMHPLTALVNGLRSGYSAYLESDAAKQAADLEDRKIQAVKDAFQNNQFDYAKAAESGAFDPQTLAKLLSDRDMKQQQMEYQKQMLDYKNQEPTTGQRDALWATGGDEQAARQLLQNKIQNPLGMLNYQLQAGNMAADNSRQNQSLDLQRQEFALRQQQANQNLDIDRQLKQLQLEKAQREFAGKAPEAGKTAVTETIAGLRDMYNQLKEKGAITSTDNGKLDNLSAGISSSGLGQTVGQMFGTESQSLRNTIAQQRPILLQQIMKATGMSSKQMDSNAELKLYLSTATDPHLDVQSNMRALDMLEKLYGIDATQQKDAVSSSIPESSGNISVDIKNPNALSDKDKQILNADIEKEKKLQELRKRHLGQ